MKKIRDLVSFLFILFVFCMLVGELSYSGGTTSIPWSCGGYNASSRKERAALTTGYLEGVQAAIDKETRDMLVPPENPDHPVWWVVPKGEITADRLETSLSGFCNSKVNEDKKLLEAFLSVAARKDGSPRTGLAFSDGPSDIWRKIFGESKLTCLNYISASETERANFIYGYSLGTKATRLTLKTPPELSLMAWPEADYRDVEARVDAGCRGTRYINSTMRSEEHNV